MLQRVVQMLQSGLLLKGFSRQAEIYRTSRERWPAADGDVL